MNFHWVWVLGSLRQARRAGSLAQRGPAPELPAGASRISPPAHYRLACSLYAATPFALSSAATRRWSGLAPGSPELAFTSCLDFAPYGHVSLDHPWLDQHPEFFYLKGTSKPSRTRWGNHRRPASGPRILAYGRDPYFPGWSEHACSLQTGHPGPAKAITELLRSLARARHGGVRCDMAMLALLGDLPAGPGGRLPLRKGRPPWTRRSGPRRSVRRARRIHGLQLSWPRSTGTSKWGTCRGKGLTSPTQVPLRLPAPLAVLARYETTPASPTFSDAYWRVFFENHDEPRAAATFPGPLTRRPQSFSSLCPGLRFSPTRGNSEGRRLHASTHLGTTAGRAPRRGHAPVLWTAPDLP